MPGRRVVAVPWYILTAVLATEAIRTWSRGNTRWMVTWRVSNSHSRWPGLEMLVSTPQLGLSMVTSAMALPIASFRPMIISMKCFGRLNIGRPYLN